MVQFISDALDTTDEFPGMKGFNIVMDNAPIHSHDIIDPITIKRGYTPVYLPIRLPELSTTEQFWKILKDRIRRDKLTDVETLTSRVIE